jgi:hypothetical protein
MHPHIELRNQDCHQEMATVFRLLAIPEATIDLSVGWNKC